MNNTMRNFISYLYLRIKTLVTCAIVASLTLAVDTLLAQSVTNLLEENPRVFRWQNIGPDRGGRSIAVAGSSQRPYEYYFGATGGGLWKTTDGGTEWFPVTDGQLNSSSVGAVAVAPSDPDRIYLGMGEAQLRSNVMQGDGVYVSQDGGTSWQHSGLAQTRTISRLRVHPENPDVVYAAALGDPFKPNPERGIYRSRDGGQSWDKILFKNDSTGACDLVIDPNNPEVLYATLWQVYRKPWVLWSGGIGSGLYKSTDGGETWQEISRNPGLPSGVWGKATVTVSPVNSQRVYANVEAKEGGLYRSDDGGATWQLMNNHRDLWQRAFYFLRIQADPVDAETVYVMNFILMKSTDGGENFRTIGTPHADHHDLWIDPANNQRMIVANDGGGTVSVNGGKSWTEQDYPTAQIYRLELTNEFPTDACGAQQDNTTVCVPTMNARYDNPLADRELLSPPYTIGGGESAAIANHPAQPDIFMAGSTNLLTRYDRATGKVQDVQPYPYLVMGQPARSMKERWNWVYPVAFSPLPPHRLYAGSQHLWESEDEGKTWQKISPDLTRADTTTLGDSGGPLVKDQDGPEIYGTLYSIAPSQHSDFTLWTGSDDGLVQLTHDRGKTWQDVTPPDLPAHSRIGAIATSRHTPGTAYVAARRYELGDRQPYLYRTTNYGQQWEKITTGIADGHFVHVVAEDIREPNLLYAGTEHGVYVSLDQGQRWVPFQQNLPNVHVSGIQATDHQLIIATHGRSFWKMDNVGLLRQLAENTDLSSSRLLVPDYALRRMVPAQMAYYLDRPVDSLSLTVIDSSGAVVRRLRASRKSAGLHSFRWDLRTEGATVFPNMILEGPSPATGPYVAPGRFQVVLTTEHGEQTAVLRVQSDPRQPEVTLADLRKQYELAIKVRDLTSQANEMVIRIREIREKMNEKLGQLEESAVLQEEAQQLLQTMSGIEAQLYQVNNQSPKDKIALPIKLNNRLSGLLAILQLGDQAPTEGQYQVYEELKSELEVHTEQFNQVLTELNALNKAFQEQGVGREE
ncbi:MAG: FlgD immunoglobulin-like domain containing protein [Bacteroidota bacterium]